MRGDTNAPDLQLPQTPRSAPSKLPADQILFRVLPRIPQVILRMLESSRDLSPDPGEGPNGRQTLDPGSWSTGVHEEDMASNMD